MLRRRHRTPKVAPRDAHRKPAAAPPRIAPDEVASSVPRSHRRPRPDARVPVELMLTPEALARGKRPAPAKAKSARANDVVLVTGFEPFAGAARNPSWDVCERLPARIGRLRVEVCRVPCEFRRAIEVAAQAIERHRPVLVVSLGLAEGRTHLGIERIAINVDDARIADNAGAQPVDEPVAVGGPPAYFATLPVKAMAAAVRSAGVPAEVSNSAGTYVCNHLMYGVLHFLAAGGHPARAGFIHVPSSEALVLERRGAPSMSLASMVQGVVAAIEAAQAHAADVKLAAGSLD